MKRARIIACSFLSLLVAHPPCTIAGTQSSSFAQVPVDQKLEALGTFPSIDVSLLFLDQNSRAVVPNRTPDFRIQEDHTERSVQTVSGPQTPVSVCIDVAWGRWNDLRSAVGSLVGALPSKSEVLVVFSADKPYIAVPFSTVPDAIKHFPDPWKLKAGTPQEFLDSIPVSEAYFVSHAKYPRRAFVLLTSGLPAKDLDNTIHAMLFPGAPFVYVLRMRGLIARRFEPEEQISRNRFGAFAKQLGGIALILSPGETDAADKAAEIALDIDSQYALTYTSRTTPGSDRLHRLSIELPPEMPAVDMQSVPGYYLPAR